MPPIVRVEIYSLASMVGYYGQIFTIRDNQPDRVLFTTRAYYTADEVAREAADRLRDQEDVPRPDATVTD